MCGIVAILGVSVEGQLQNALARTQHRGRDATQIWRFPPVIELGFNRLAIHDKTIRGMQPHHYEEWVGVFNGEIYNAEALKKTYGLSTASEVDTAVILPLFVKMGQDMLSLLDGFYSGVIFNQKTLEIWTIRDLMGKKNLLYGKTPEFNFITSELKAFTDCIDFQWIPKGLCVVTPDGVRLIRTHSIPFAPKHSLKNALEAAVKKRIPLKEPKWGIFLSGGLDSSIVAAIASRYADNVIYYTLSDANSVDYEHVMKLAQYLRIEEKIKVMPLPTMDALGDLIHSVVYHTESYNPSIVSNGLATYLISQAAAADGLRVALSGEGADELFSGYRLSKSALECFNKRAELIENMYFTELRRLDLASMAHTLEVRCPFLDKAVLGASESCTCTDLLATTSGTVQGKQILRELFKKELPSSIVERQKVSFDVGSGIRRQVVEYLSGFAENERQALKKIWMGFFGLHLSEHEYGHAYPTFDKMIDKRGQTHS